MYLYTDKKIDVNLINCRWNSVFPIQITTYIFQIIDTVTSSYQINDNVLN